ncbi:unnamed protein product, partial [Polarella glacialis]
VKSRILCPIILLLSLCLAPAAATGTGSGSSADAARCNNGQQAASNRQQDATTDTVNTDAACMLQVVSGGLSGAVGIAGNRLWRQDEQKHLKPPLSTAAAWAKCLKTEGQSCVCKRNHGAPNRNDHHHKRLHGHKRLYGHKRWHGCCGADLECHKMCQGQLRCLEGTTGASTN